MKQEQYLLQLAAGPGRQGGRFSVDLLPHHIGRPFHSPHPHPKTGSFKGSVAFHNIGLIANRFGKPMTCCNLPRIWCNFVICDSIYIQNSFRLCLVLYEQSGNHPLLSSLSPHRKPYPCTRHTGILAVLSENATTCSNISGNDKVWEWASC